ncbi:MAG: hypothetical protein ACOX52_15225, partial [Verrucomicrobiota bacterium]
MNPIPLFLRYRRLFIILLHALLAMLVYALAFALRFDGVIPEQFFPLFLKTLPGAVILKVVIMDVFKLHRGLWRYVSLDDLVRLVKAVTVSTVCFVLFNYFILHLNEFPRSIYLIDWMLAVMVFAGKRVVIR